jgi:hypothetical protein
VLAAQRRRQRRIQKTAEANGVAPATLERAIAILQILQRGGEELDDFVLREYILDGRLQGYYGWMCGPVTRS